MSQHDYQTTQSFGLISCVAFWVTKDVHLKKAVYELMFTDTTHCTKRICQGLDFALVELQNIMLSDGIELKNLYLYSDCAVGDQKNKYFVCHISELLNVNSQWIPVRYFQRPANHNKFDFDSEGGLFKLKYFLAARDSANKTLQWARGGLKNGGLSQLHAIAKFMNAPTSSWQQIGDSAKTSIRKAIVLPSLDTKHQYNPFQCKGISTNYAIATIGYHKVVQRHLMNLRDECLLKAFDRTPELTSDEDSVVHGIILIYPRMHFLCSVESTQLTGYKANYAEMESLSRRCGLHHFLRRRQGNPLF